MTLVLEAVSVFGEGRDLDGIRELVQVVAEEGAEVLDWTGDRDHHRSVVASLPLLR